MNSVRRVFASSRPGQQIAANIYRPASPRTSGKQLTLVLAHANGFHKELWEPTLERLFAYHGNGWCIQQAVALDGYNHGDSAIFNRATIEAEKESPWFLNARDILAVLPQLDNPQNIIGIGHSWGASSMLLAEIMAPLTFSALIAADPVLFPRFERNEGLIAMTMRRRFQWKDMDEARAYFEPHQFFSRWDSRVLQLYMKHGIQNDGGLVLKCRPVNEAAVYAGSFHASPHTKENLWRIQCPTAFLTGEKSEIAAPAYIQDAIKGISDCRHTVMPKAGHLLLLENPDGTADSYASFLDSFAPKIGSASKL